jgi:hypothetical protein
MLRACAAATVAILCAGPVARGEVAGAGPAEGRAILERAFSNLYDCDLRAILKLTLRTRRGEESVRHAEIARKRIRGHMHSYGLFLEPSWMRGTAVLVLDQGEAGSEHFLFLPDQRRVRRVTSVQRTDSFLGSDLWYEDLERRDPGQLAVEGLGEALVEGERAWEIGAAPRDPSRYQRVVYLVAASDHLLLRSAFFRGGAEQPFRTIESPRRSARAGDGHVLPTLLLVRDRLRGTTTEARFEQLEINPELSDSLFSAVALEAGRRVSGIGDPTP